MKHFSHPQIPLLGCFENLEVSFQDSIQTLYLINSGDEPVIINRLNLNLNLKSIFVVTDFFLIIVLLNKSI